MAQQLAISTNELFAKLKPEVDTRFPAGQFVAVEAGVVVADAESHRKLIEKLCSLNKCVTDMLIFQAGVDYPSSAVIL